MEKLFQMVQDYFGRTMTPQEMINHRADFEDEAFYNFFLGILKHVYSEDMPFNRYLGVIVESLTKDLVICTLNNKPELIGNFHMNILHGGVISAALDLTGGAIAQANALKNLSGKTLGEIYQLLGKMSTINMRVDYLRPGAGEKFRLEGRVKRSGSKVGVTSVEMFDDKESCIALGTGSYMVGCL
jgi:uncharacterized protein (TIGR00369 family)